MTINLNHVANQVTTTGSDTNIGLNLNSKGTGEINLNTGNGTQFKVVDSATPTVIWQAFGTSGNAVLRASGAGLIQSGGATPIGFHTNAGTPQFNVAHTASTVNYVQVTGGTTGNLVTISAQGSDTNVGMELVAKGIPTGPGFRIANTTGVCAAVQMSVSSPVNYPYLQPAATGSAPSFTANGSDTNISLNLTPKGTGAVIANGPFTATGQTSLGGTFGSEGLRVTTTASANRYVQISGGQSGVSSPSVGAAGGSTALDLYTNGGGTFNFYTNGNGSARQVAFTHTASAVNYVQVTGAISAGTPKISAQGSDSDISLVLASKNTGTLQFETNGVRQFNISNTTSAVNFLNVTGSATNNAVALACVGSDAQIDLNIAAKGFGAVNIGAGTPVVAKFLYATSTDTSFWKFRSSAGNGVNVDVVASGTVSNIGFNIGTKGTASTRFFTGDTGSFSGGVEQARVTHTASAVNYAQVTGSATGGSPVISAQGSDTSIDLTLTPKGAGVVTISSGGLEFPDATVQTTAAVSDAVVGSVIFHAANSAPTGYLKANGAAVSRYSYASLFAVIGTTFGSGDGSTTFNVPDMRGYFPRGWVDNGSVDSGRAFGSTQTDAFASHSHTLTIYDAQFGGGNNGIPPSGGANFIANRATSSTGGTETRPVNVALLACIKY